jgi:hypothetical protein
VRDYELKLEEVKVSYTSGRGECVREALGASRRPLCRKKKRVTGKGVEKEGCKNMWRGRTIAAGFVKDYCFSLADSARKSQ